MSHIVAALLPKIPWCGPGAGLVRAWCGPSLQREVEVLVNFAEGAQTVSSLKFAGRVLRWRSPENLQILTV